MSFKKSLFKVFSANFLQTITSILIGFIIPSILTFQGYADLKTYTLYMTYVGVFNLGYIDGIYLKYGGKEEKEISKSKLKGEHTFLVLQQLLVTILLLIIALVVKDTVLLLMTISILPANLVGFHKQYYQAIGNFENYSKIMNVYSISYVIVNLFFVFILKSTNFVFYCLASFLCNLAILIVAEYHFYKSVKSVKMERPLLNKETFTITKAGFFLMIGNLTAVLLYAIDKWFVKIFFTVEDFSYYSFAVSMFNIIVVFLNSICITFYNLFAKGKTDEFIKKVKDKLLVIGAVASGSYFFLALIVNIFLKKYNPALSVIAVSFATFPYLFVIKAIFVNLYKSQKSEKRYTKIVFLMLILACLLNLVGMIISKDIYMISIATLLTFIIWYFFSFKDFRYLKSDIREIIFLVLSTTTFLFCAHLENIYLGGLLYLLVLIFGFFVVLKTNVKDFLKI